MDIKDFTFIVICEEDHYNPLGVVRSLGEEGISPVVISYGNKIHMVSASKYVNNVYRVNTLEDAYAFLLKRYYIHGKKVFIIACDDKVSSFFDHRYEQLKDRFYFYNAGKNGRITFFMDKNNINILAEKHGFKVPKAFVVKRGEIRNNFEYPVLTKAISSNSGAWKKDVFLCKNENELKEAFQKIKSEVVLIQKFIEKKNELCIDGFSINKGKDVVYTIASTYNYNISGKYAYDYNSYTLKDEKLINKLNSMFEDIGYEGIFSVEFLIDKNNELQFMEINFRNSGWSYTSTCVGMNLPILWAKGMIKGKLPEKSLKKIEGKFRTIFEFRDFLTRVGGRKVSLLAWIRDLKNVDCFLIYNKKDMKPFKVILLDKLRIWKRLKKSNQIF